MTHPRPSERDLAALRERVRRFEAYRDDEADTYYRAATDRTWLLGLLDAARSVVEAERPTIDEFSLTGIASALAGALEFHRRTSEGGRKECLPGCIGCAALDAWERHTGRSNWTGAKLTCPVPGCPCGATTEDEHDTRDAE